MLPGIMCSMFSQRAFPSLVGVWSYTDPVDSQYHTITNPTGVIENDLIFLLVSHPGFSPIPPTPSNWTRVGYAGPTAQTAYTARTLLYQYTGGGVPPSELTFALQTGDSTGIDAITFAFRAISSWEVVGAFSGWNAASQGMIAPSVSISTQSFGIEIRFYTNRAGATHTVPLSGFTEIDSNYQNSSTRYTSVYYRGITVGGTLSTVTLNHSTTPYGEWCAGSVVSRV